MLQHLCSICVFPYTGAGCQAAWDESWGALCLYPPIPGFLTDRHFPSLLPHGNIHQKKKKCTIPPEICALSSSDPSPSLLSPFLSAQAAAHSSCLPLLPCSSPGPGAAPSLSEVFPSSPGVWEQDRAFPLGALVVQLWQPGASLVPSLPGLSSHSDSHGLPWAVFIVCWAKNKGPKCWVP